MARDIENDTYSVGYGKPPQESRFQPGKSGNPAGRPKGRETFKKKVQKALTNWVTVSVNGENKRMSVEDAAIMSLMQGLLKAPPEKKIAILKYLRSFQDDEQVAPDEFCYENLSDDELEQLERLLTKGQKCTG